jgi:hypothetical protein
VLFKKYILLSECLRFLSIKIIYYNKIKYYDKQYYNLIVINIIIKKMKKKIIIIVKKIIKLYETYIKY